MNEEKDKIAKEFWDSVIKLGEAINLVYGCQFVKQGLSEDWVDGYLDKYSPEDVKSAFLGLSLMSTTSALIVKERKK